MPALAKMNAATLEAAVCLAGGMQGVPTIVGNKIVDRPMHEVFGEPALDAASRHFRNGISLQELMLEAAIVNGYSGGSFRSDAKGVLRAAMIQADGFSTFSLPGILSNVANKFLLQGFTTVEDAWRAVAARRPVNDFKTSTSYRLTGAFQFEKLSAGGEIKHGVAGETAFTNRAETYAKLFGISRQDLYNDDLGALTTVPQRLGRGAALKLNDVFWTTFLANSALFTTGNKNYLAGSATNLSSASLQLAEQSFSDQVDEDGKPIAVAPAILLTPTALKRPAMELMHSGNFIVGLGGSDGAKIPAANTWAGAYQVVPSAYLGNTAYTGSSSTAWYLLADPKDLAAIEVVFLNGNESPTVEQTDADFDSLGIQMRGYYDFGVTLTDYRAGVKVKGVA